MLIIAMGTFVRQQDSIEIESISIEELSRPEIDSEIMGSLAIKKQLKNLLFTYCPQIAHLPSYAVKGLR
jgi:hypothetical protein